MRRHCIGLAVTLALGLWASAAESQALRYVDEYGVVHWVKSKEQIPEKYRDKAEKPDVPLVNTPTTPASKQRVWEICQGTDGSGRGVSVDTQRQCEAWLRSEAMERQRRIREQEIEQRSEQRRIREYEREQRRRYRSP